jgi:PhnB protein
MEVIPNLHFNGDCEKAIELYEQAFGAKRTVLLWYQDAHPADIDQESSDEKQELVYHAEIMVGNQRIILNDNIDDIPYGINVSLLLSFDSTKKVKEAYEILKDGARIITPIRETTYSSCFVSLIDRYGVRWELMKES